MLSAKTMGSRAAALLVPVLLAALTSACGSAPEGGASNAAAPPAVPVGVAAVKPATVRETTSYVATLISRRSVTMQPRVAGQISRILVQAGDVVSAGAPLIEIDPSTQQANTASFEAAVRSSREALASAEQTLRSYRADRQSRVANLALSTRQYDRYIALGKEGAVSQDTVDQYRNTLESNRASLEAVDAQIRSQQAQVARAKSDLKQAQANLDQQRAQLAFYRIAAPFAGSVGDIPVKVGDYVATSTQLLTVTENQPLEVNVAVPQERAAQLRKGMTVELLDSQGALIGTSRIFFIAPNVNANSQAVLVKASYPNAENRLRADQVVQSRMIWSQQTGVTVPVAAVSRVADQNFVFVAQEEGGKLVAHQRPIQLGEIEGNNYQVKSGLSPGQRIVVSGIQKLIDGAPIVAQ